MLLFKNVTIFIVLFFLSGCGFQKVYGTGQKDNTNLSIGFSATWSRPLDTKLQKLCKDAAAANINLMQQVNANKRLDFEIARLKNCGELMKAGIRFTPGTQYSKICADVQVKGVNFMVPHIHSIPSTNASDLGLPIETGQMTK